MAGASVNLSLRDRMKRALLAMNFVLLQLIQKKAYDMNINVNFN